MDTVTDSAVRPHGPTGRTLEPGENALDAMQELIETATSYGYRFAMLFMSATRKAEIVINDDLAPLTDAGCTVSTQWTADMARQERGEEDCHFILTKWGDDPFLTDTTPKGGKTRKGRPGKHASTEKQASATSDESPESRRAKAKPAKTGPANAQPRKAKPAKATEG